ncbi:three-Cys-motif partner protein TcmP [Polyangium sp. 15x6]|uniref:three-Cys-motif partner protein TcmP n=1 Tax=Polyangium sp. 15x6 TaxID=3042687 RepID=UPI00249B13E8|nr:three-Cys-motif partner protein TcmP [Polyangium sp. 15x6]MDI3291555.1 three-Cys-motif partner protein TcmP [Polyangium sp. 15x6]
MPKKEYDWSSGPAVLEPHSLAKHTILQKYVERYVQILMRGGKVPQLGLVVVDGFAGGGEYVIKGESTIRPGSPLILIEGVRKAIDDINKPRQKPIVVDDRYVFIERNAAAFRYLDDTLVKRFGASFCQEKVHRIHGSFEDHIWGVVDQILSMPKPTPRPIFVLDQYGYSDVPVDMIRGILQKLPKAEVFLTLAVEHISAYASSMQEALATLRSTIHVDVDSLSALIEGRKEIEQIDEMTGHDRNQTMLYVQWLLHETFAKHAGATCYTPFFITSTKSHRSYWFLHLANSARANDVVKELHWDIANHFRHHGRPGTKMLVLGFDPSKASKDQLAFDFAFDDSARAQTVEALIDELPALLQEKYKDGVSLRTLYENLCNTTPGSKNMLGESLNTLCGVGELRKEGAKGEVREPMTKLLDTDIVRPSVQSRLFSIPDLRKKR